MIRGTSLAKVYGEGSWAVHALRGVDITLEAGEIVAVMGASGSGKSTLLHVLSGLDRPTSGQVDFRGRDLASMSEDDLSRLRASEMAFVLQKENLVPSLSLRENVALPLVLSGRSWRPSLAEADTALELVHLSHRAQAWPSEVSGGEAQRAAIARACVVGPAVIFADEPTGALDSANGAAVLSLFRELATGSGAAAVVVTHDAAVGEVADRVIRLHDGVLADG